MHNIELKQLQESLAKIDSSQSRGRSSQGCMGYLVLKLSNIKIKIYQEKGHHNPHIHIDYGNKKHVASYEIESGDLLVGELKSKYSKAIKKWINNNKQTLKSIWSSLQKGDNRHEPYIASLAGTFST